MSKEKFIVSFNLAGWAWDSTGEAWGSRLVRACQMIKEEAPNAWLIGLSEVIPGTNNQYIATIQKHFPDYLIVFPEGYQENYRSAINILLINKEGYRRHNVRTLDQLEDSLLYNYVTLVTEYGWYRILSVHMPHTCNADKPEAYQQKRKALRKYFEEAVVLECEKYRNEPDIQFIFMGDLNAGPEDAYIRKLTNPCNPVLFNAIPVQERKKPTWKKQGCTPAHLDYIFYSIGSLTGDVIDVCDNDIIMTPIENQISDHAMILGRVRTNTCTMMGDEVIKNGEDQESSYQ